MIGPLSAVKVVPGVIAAEVPKVPTAVPAINFEPGIKYERNLAVVPLN